MFLEILSITLLFSTYVGSSAKQKDGTPERPFVCTSGRGPPVLKKEDGSSSSEVAMRSFLLDKNAKWLSAYVPYVIDKSFSEKQVAMIHEEIKKITSISCVRWEARKNQRDFVTIKHDEDNAKCATTVGRLGGEQLIYLGNDCFEVEKGYQGALVHEMMHILGFVHEQQRVDRDCYVSVVQSAIEKSPADYATRANTSLDFPYDFGSIMQYGTTDLLKSQNGETLGNLDGKLTEMDVLKLNFMYCEGKSFCEQRPADCNKFRQAEEACLRKRQQN